MQDKMKNIIDELIERFEIDEDSGVPYFTNPSYENAILGYSDTMEGVRIIYSYDGIIESLMGEGMTEEEAMEFYSYNIEPVLPYMGNNSPIILQKFTCL